MRICLHIGPDADHADRLQRILDAKRAQLQRKGVLYPRSPGARNHTRLFMAVSDLQNVDILRFNRGFIAPDKVQVLRETVGAALAREAEGFDGHTMILSAHQLGSTLHTRSELERLRAMLLPISTDIRVVAHLDDPARMLLRRYAAQIAEGRAVTLDAELDCVGAPSFWEAALASRPEADPARARFADVQGAAFWLDYTRLQREWEAVFGHGTVEFRSLDPVRLASESATEDLRAAFGISANIGKADPARPAPAPSAAWLTRCRLFNDALLRLLARGEVLVPRQLWRKLQIEFAVEGPPIAPGSLAALSDRFASDIAALCERHQGLDQTHMAPDAPEHPWQEADPTLGFRATQYLTAFRWHINQATQEELATREADIAALDAAPTAEAAQTLGTDPDEQLSPTARAVMPSRAKQHFMRLNGSPFQPHNRLGRVNEEDLAAAFVPAPACDLPNGTSGRVIVGCMKNEAPYILEWVAYHRAIGFDNFLIYTNGCEDGTTEILERLQALGILKHRNNDNWSGKSPQQHALDKALKEPVVRNADWIAHIDVDEFVNIRCGNGTLDDLFERIPDATNVAMTWRLFGHNGVTTLSDRFVTDQFDTCAPKYCPKPHTVWGFKTMFRNIGAYGKISCHRPNKLTRGFEDRVKWVNGSGREMTSEVLRNGWRSSRKSIGYDLVQLNHYALRSAESFLIKRQRGRALHVDRSIGINYWIRMDWSVHRDITIKRNLPRLRAEYDRLMADPVLKDWHGKALDWHRTKARALHKTPEFEDLYQQALTLSLTETERVAYALALDMEN